MMGMLNADAFERDFSFCLRIPAFLKAVDPGRRFFSLTAAPDPLSEGGLRSAVLCQLFSQGCDLNLNEYLTYINAENYEKAGTCFIC